MSKEATIEKIKLANAVLGLAITLHQQLKSLEKEENEQAMYYFDSLILIQTSFYHTLVLNLCHLLMNNEKHSIAELTRLSISHLELENVVGKEILKKLEAYQEKIKLLKVNRDKRIAHFDKGNMQPLSDDHIEELLSIAQELLGELNERVLKTSHSFGIAFSRGMENVMKILREQIERENTKNDL